MIYVFFISSLRAFRRARDGAAKGRGSWERSRWPDAKFEVTSAKCDLRIEQQPEKREESREKRDGHRRSSDVLATNRAAFGGTIAEPRNLRRDRSGWVEWMIRLMGSRPRTASSTRRARSHLAVSS